MIRFWIDVGCPLAWFWLASWFPNPSKLEPKPTWKLKQNFNAFLGGGDHATDAELGGGGL